MKKIEFTKMHSLGNDFIVLDCTKKNLQVSKKFIKNLASRNYGVGCDQVLLIKRLKNNSFDYEIYNQDGSKSGQCINGAKCVVKYIAEKYHLANKAISLITKTIEMKALSSRDSKGIKISFPYKEISELETVKKTGFTKNKKSITVNDKSYSFELAYVGNPHCIIFAKNIAKININAIAEAINKKQIFSNGINLTLAQVDSKSKIQIRTFERGTGETLSCGSASVSTALVSFKLGKTFSRMNIYSLGGYNTVMINSQNIDLIGSANKVFEGIYIVNENRR